MGEVGSFGSLLTMEASETVMEDDSLFSRSAAANISRGYGTRKIGKTGKLRSVSIYAGTSENVCECECARLVQSEWGRRTETRTKERVTSTFCLNFDIHRKPKLLSLIHASSFHNQPQPIIRPPRSRRLRSSEIRGRTPLDNRRAAVRFSPDTCPSHSLLTVLSAAQ